MDKIIIKDACFLCNIGVSEKERKKKRAIYIDAELFLDTRKSAKTDKLKDTVDYSDVYGLMKNIAENSKCRLIEALAQNVADGILNKFPLSKIIVRVKKTRLKNKNIRYAAVEITRVKNA